MAGESADSRTLQMANAFTTRDSHSCLPIDRNCTHRPSQRLFRGQVKGLETWLYESTHTRESQAAITATLYMGVRARKHNYKNRLRVGHLVTSSQLLPAKAGRDPSKGKV